MHLFWHTADQPKLRIARAAHSSRDVDCPLVSSLARIERAGELIANDGDTTTYHYDGVGNLDAHVVENGASAVTTDYQYDALNRLVYMVHFDDLNADLAYDDQTETLFASFTYTLDSRGNRIASSEIVGGDTYHYTWVYDDLNRLVSEVLDAGNSALDYTDTYTYDLAGNRLSKTRDKGSDASIEETTAYTYDANDRLLTETFDSTENGGTADDRFTTYAFDNTTQTGKTVREGLDNTGTLRSQTSMTYNEMGRLASTTVTTYDTSGTQLSEVVTEYGYDDNGLRITETTTIDGGTPEVKSFLFDPRNPTGFAQVLEEYVNATLKNVFTIGHDVIAQTDVTNPQAPVVHTLLSDGHGSTRTLLDKLNAIVQRYAYDAYGNMLSAAGLTTAAAALTSILYSGEWTMKSGQQYLRARIYDPASGTFNRLDPFAGNLADPQSLHKYLYTHANPVAFSDPTGYLADSLLLAGQSGGTTSWVRVMTSGVIGAVFARGEAFVRTLYLTGDIDAAEAAAADAAAAGFVMGIAVGMLEGRLTPYIGAAAFGLGLAQAKHEWQAGHHALATVDFTLAVFSFFTGVYKSVKMPVRGKPLRPGQWDADASVKPPGWSDGSDWRWGPSSREGDNSWRWFDPDGGEWRYHDVDSWHQTPHWDYNSWDHPYAPWQNVNPPKDYFGYGQTVTPPVVPQ